MRDTTTVKLANRKRISHVKVLTCICSRSITIPWDSWGNIRDGSVLYRTCFCRRKWEFMFSLSFHENDGWKNGDTITHVLYRIDVAPVQGKEA